MPRQLMVRVGVERKYGDHKIYFEIAEQIEVETGQDRRDAYNNLMAQLEDQINVYEVVSLPHVKLPNSGLLASTGSQSADTFSLEQIIVENVKGQRRVSALGGKWKKHGVPVYKECDCALDLENLAYGSHEMKHLGLIATVEFQDGKPKRVRSIK